MLFSPNRTRSGGSCMPRRVLINVNRFIVLFVVFLLLGIITAPLYNHTFQLTSGSVDSKGPATRALKEPDEVVYAIIAPQSFESSLQPLVDWKTQKGVPTQVFTTEYIIGQYPGLPDLEAKVHAFLEDLEDDEVNLTYVMLAGDSEIIPPRYLYTNAYFIGFTDYYAGDVYYAGLDNDWDTDDDGYYGEYSTSSGFDADLNFDVTVGRLPIDTSAHVDNVVDKVLTYEKNPPVGDWVSKMEIWGTIMDAPNDPTKYDSWEDNAYKVGEKVYDIMKDNYSVNRRYDYSKLPGGDYTLATDYLKKSVVLTPVNDGLSIINYAGQAWYDGTTIAHYNSNTGMHDTNSPTAWPSRCSSGPSGPTTSMPTSCRWCSRAG